MTNEIFSIVSHDKEKIVLKVSIEDNLTAAMHPYISRNCEYITVTRGKNHILVAINKDGTSFSFQWGSNGYEIIDERTTMLKLKVREFISSQGLLIDLDDDKISEATICFNPNWRKWQLTLNDKAYYWSDKATNIDEMIAESKKFVDASLWEHSIAITGIDVWKAKLPDKLAS